MVGLRVRPGWVVSFNVWLIAIVMLMIEHGERIPTPTFGCAACSQEAL